jgi:hypothetical protein
MEIEEKRRRKAEYMRTYMALNPEQREKRNKYLAQYRKNNLEKAEKYRKQYYLDNKEKLLAKNLDWMKKNYQQFLENQKKWKKVNGKKYKDFTIEQILKANLRTRLWDWLKRERSLKSIEILGCTPSELRAHLENLWKPGMTWDNYGRKQNIRCWHIDHIKPIALFDLTKEEQIKECFGYLNLQPLWADENLKKGKKLCYVKK